MALRFDPPTRARLRRLLMKKGQAIAGDLAELLAGGHKRIDRVELPASARKPGMRPEEQLRAYLDRVESVRKLLDADDDRFGRCTNCGGDLGIAALDEMPWADTCQICTPQLAIVR